MANCCMCGEKLAFMGGIELDYYTDQKMCENCNTFYTQLKKYKTMETEADFHDVLSAKDYFEKCINKKTVSKLALVTLNSMFTGVDNAKKRYYEIQKENEEAEKRAIIERKIELEKREYANSFHEYYEYDVVTIINEEHGRVDRYKMMSILAEHARNGWKLHSIYSNELGKNAIKVLGLAVNATACEDVLIFERRVSNID